MNGTADKRRPWGLILGIVGIVIALALIRRFPFWSTAVIAALLAATLITYFTA